MSSAVPHGTVLFSTKMAPGLACIAISLVAPSNAVTSVAEPAPKPLVFVGVLTVIRIISASAMHFATSVEKNRFGTLAGTATRSLCSSPSLSDDDMLSGGLVGPLRNVQAREPSRAMRTISLNPVSWIGRCLDFQLAIRAGSLSTTLTRIDGFWKAMTADVGPPRKLRQMLAFC
jgi:hypothetical protein